MEQVAAWDKCTEILASINSRTYLSRSETNTFFAVRHIRMLAHCNAFTVALDGLDMDATIDGKPFFFWAAGKNSAGIQVILRGIKNLSARDPETGDTIAHHMMRYIVGISRMRHCDLPTRRALLTARNNDGNTPLHTWVTRETYCNKIFRIIYSSGLDLFSLRGVSGKMAVERFQGGEKHENTLARCKVFVFARERHILARDGDNAILFRIGEFMFDAHF